MKKLLYIANLRLPTEKAYGIQIVKMCEALADQGLSVKLVLPTRRNQIKESIFSYYQAKKKFKVKKLSSPDFYWPGGLDRFSVVIKNFISAVILSIYALFNQAEFIYSREELPLYLLSFFKRNLIFEAHRYSLRRVRYYRRFKKIGLKIVVISNGVKEELIKFGFKPEKIIIAPDGVDLELFAVNKTKSECREILSLPQDKKIILYTGHFYKWKGAGILVDAAQNFQDIKNIFFVFVGGTESDVNNFRDKIEGMKLDNIEIVGHVLHNKVPLYLRAADILILPNSSGENISRLYTSPLKMFEYMSSGKPIIASNLPSIREILTEDHAFFSKPDDPQDLTVVINEVINNTSEAEKRAQRSLLEVVRYSWQARAGQIIKFISN